MKTAALQVVKGASAGPLAMKQMLAYQIEREMALQNIGRVKMAKLMQTSRAAVNRLLDPSNNAANLQTIERAAKVLGKEWHIFLKG